MPVTDLGSSTSFVTELRRSGLIERSQLEMVLESVFSQSAAPEPEELAQYLVQQGYLTTFQADRILNGKSQGLILGPYVIHDTIGVGSMGAVYRAVSRNDRKTYAVKVLPRRSMWNVRLARRQVRAFGQFSHPAVVPFVDVGTSGGLHYLVWNFVEGQSLEALVQQLGRLDVPTVARIGQQIATGLNAAHSHGLVHGLVKPSNIMLDRSGEAKLLDFGIGSLLAENESESLVDTMSTANTLTSGLDCASPESIMEPSNRTAAGDQYSLGCTLYFCLTGRYPFPEGTAVEKMMAHQTKQPTPIRELVPEVPPAMAAVVDRLMQKKPEERFIGIDEVAEALAPFVSSVVKSASSSSVLLAVSSSPKTSLSSVRLDDTPSQPGSGSGTIPGQSVITTPPPSAASSGSLPKPAFTAGAGETKNPPSAGHLQLPTRQSMLNASMSSTVLNLGRLPAPATGSPAASAPSSVKPAGLSMLGRHPSPTPAGHPQGFPSLASPAIPSASLTGVGVPHPAMAPSVGEFSGVHQVEASSPVMGPLGFLALGATVALAGYMVAMSLLH